MAEHVTFLLPTLKFARGLTSSSFSVPDQDYNWTVTLAGELHVTWLRKFSMFQEDNPVDISWLQTPGTIGGSNNGTARMSIVPGLRLGAAYTVSDHSTCVHSIEPVLSQVTMMDLASEDALLTFSFTACKLELNGHLELC